jgi:hypothetical protein
MAGLGDQLPTREPEPMSESNKITPEQKHVLACLGVMLLHIQGIEKVIHVCVSYVFPKTPLRELSILALQERTESLRAKTIGYLLRELKARVGIDDTFENVLSKFLEMRNTFVHNIDEIPGWSLDSEDGIAVAHRFLSELDRVSGIVQGVFLGIVRSWQEENQIETEWADRNLLTEIDAFYKPLAHRWFVEKE